jgi:hypothetical protein
MKKLNPIISDPGDEQDGSHIIAQSDNIYLQISAKNGNFDFPIGTNKIRFENFMRSVPDGVKLDVYISYSTNKASNAQLARIHAMCRELANSIGYTFDEIKKLIKDRSGLYYINNNKRYYRSFADCDKMELNMAIQSCIEIGDFNNINLR